MRSFDEEDGALQGPAIDLDLSKGPPMIVGPSSGGKIPVQQAAGSIGIHSGMASGDAATPGPAPGARPPAADPGPKGAGLSKRAADEVDPYEVRALADYGDPPSAWWRAPLYAYRVLRRRPELKKTADQKKRELDRAQGAEEDALLAYAEVVRSKAEKLAAYAGAFEEVRAAEQLLGTRDAQLAAETDAHRHRQAELDAGIAELEAQLTQTQIEERTIAGELGEAEVLLKRADARVKRIDIEIRNATTQAGGAPQEPGARGSSP